MILQRVSHPIPLAAPVIMITLPWSVDAMNAYGVKDERENKNYLNLSNTMDPDAKWTLYFESLFHVCYDLENVTKSTAAWWYRFNDGPPRKYPSGYLRNWASLSVSKYLLESFLQWWKIFYFLNGDDSFERDSDTWFTRLCRILQCVWFGCWNTVPGVIWFQ